MFRLIGVQALLFFLMLSVCCSLTSRASPQNHARHYQPLIVGLSTSTYWSSGSSRTSETSLHYQVKVRPLKLYVGRDHPNGTQVLVVFGDSGVNLMLVAKHPGLFDDGSDAFDEDGELKTGYYMQVGQCDFQHNGVPFIVVAVGNGLTNLHVTVLKYHPPASQEDAIRLENWEEVGSFTGQVRARIDGDTISLPFGSVGLETEYAFVKNEFVETDGLRSQVQP